MHQGDAERMSCMKHKAYFAFLTALILCAGLVSGCSKADSGDSTVPGPQPDPPLGIPQTQYRRSNWGLCRRHPCCP